MSSALRPETGLDLPPDRPPRVGIIGGGQLARRMAQAAVSLGVEVHVLAGSSDEGVPGVFASVTTGDPEDVAAIDAFADTVDVVTFDHENVSWEALDALVARALAGGTQGVMQVAVTAPQNQIRKNHDQNHHEHQQ